ncbi:MAG: 16S rRNA (cytosine(1402)-N(4))-methyltransferase RsmH [Planctomycetaceae bacterium]
MSALPIQSLFRFRRFMVSNHSSSSVHVPVLLREVLREMQLSPGLTVVDGTLGGGGHSREILPRILPEGRLLGLDRDPMMIELARRGLNRPEVELRQGSYADLPAVLTRLGWGPVDRILVDLGLSSDQLADESRSFSFHSPGELDLRFDRSQGISAAEMLAEISVEELERILREYGEEPYSRPIAQHLVERRKSSPVRTGLDLADAVRGCPGVRFHDASRHPATLVFQALRIAVNQELEHVRQAVEETFPQSLRSGGMLAVITFHSLEDRIVKQAFRRRETWDVLTAKPIVATPVEARFNPRSRSAKLRLARKK